MTLREALACIHELDPTAVLYVSPLPRWTAHSRCLALVEPADGSPPERAAGLTYLIDVAQVERVKRVWARNRAGHEPSLEELCEAVIYFARFDAHQPALAV